MENSQLIIACKKQDRQAQKELYETYGSKMMGICLRYADNDDAARDLLHDGFIQVFTQIGSYTGKGSFEGWLRRIFVNLALNNYRTESKKRKMTDDLQTIDSIPDSNEDDIFEITDISREELLQALRELPEGYRTVINLYIFEELSHKEIGKMLGINESGSRSQFFRAKAFLYKKLSALSGRDRK